MNQLAQEIIAANVAPGSIRIWWIGQEGFVIKSPRLIIYIDLNTGDVTSLAGWPGGIVCLIGDASRRIHCLSGVQ